MLILLIGEQRGWVPEVDARSVVYMGGGNGVGGEGTCVEDLAHVDGGFGGGIGYYYAVEGAERGEGV